MTSSRMTTVLLPFAAVLAFCSAEGIGNACAEVGGSGCTSGSEESALLQRRVQVHDEITTEADAQALLQAKLAVDKVEVAAPPARNARCPTDYPVLEVKADPNAGDVCRKFAGDKSGHAAPFGCHTTTGRPWTVSTSTPTKPCKKADYDKAIADEAAANKAAVDKAKADAACAGLEQQVVAYMKTHTQKSQVLLQFQAELAVDSPPPPGGRYGPAVGPALALGWQDESYGFIDNKHNLPNTPVVGKTLQECIDVCKAEQDCKAFSYEKPGNGEPKPTSNCWLKDSTEHESRGNRLGRAQHWFTYVVRNEPAAVAPIPAECTACLGMPNNGGCGLDRSKMTPGGGPQNQDIVVYNSYEYACMDRSAKFPLMGSGQCSRGICNAPGRQGTSCCQKDYITLPTGWELVPYSDEVCEHVVFSRVKGQKAWGTGWLHFSDSMCHTDTGKRDSRNFLVSETTAAGGVGYKVSDCDIKILMRRKAKKATSSPRAFVCAASEGDDCSCSGNVYFGKKFVSGRPGSGTITSFEQMKSAGTKQKTVAGSVKCTNGEFGGDPVRNFYKHCFCDQAMPEEPSSGGTWCTGRGGPLENKVRDNWAACGAACAAHSSCTCFEFNIGDPKGGGLHQCRLTSGVAQSGAAVIKAANMPKAAADTK